jgi:hypothetical protein
MPSYETLPIIFMEIEMILFDNSVRKRYLYIIEINIWPSPYQPGYHSDTQSRADMGRGLIAGKIWKRSYICSSYTSDKLFYEANKLIHGSYKTTLKNHSYSFGFKMPSYEMLPLIFIEVDMILFKHNVLKMYLLNTHLSFHINSFNYMK